MVTASTSIHATRRVIYKKKQFDKLKKKQKEKHKKKKSNQHTIFATLI